MKESNVYYLGESLTAENISTLEKEMNLDDVQIIAEHSNDRIQKILAKEVLKLNGRSFVESDPTPTQAQSNKIINNINNNIFKLAIRQ